MHVIDSLRVSNHRHTTEEMVCVGRLRNLCEQNDAAKALITVFSNRRRDITETTVKRAAELVGIEYLQMVKVLRDIAATGVGTFIVGRRGGKSRIVWNYDIRDIFATINGIPVRLSLYKDESSLVHHFHLRGKKISVELPTNITQHEANAFAAFIQTIPGGKVITNADLSRLFEIDLV